MADMSTNYVITRAGSTAATLEHITIDKFLAIVRDATKTIQEASGDESLDLPDIVDIKLTAAAFLKVAVGWLGDDFRSHKNPLPMSNIVAMYGQFSRDVKKLNGLKGTKLTMLSDLTIVQEIMGNVPKQRSGKDTQIHVDTINCTDTSLDRSDSPKSRRFCELLQSMGDTLASLSTLINSIGSQFNTIISVRELIASTSRGTGENNFTKYFVQLFPRQTQDFSTAEAFMKFQPHAKGKNQWTNLTLLTFMYSIAKNHPSYTDKLANVHLGMVTDSVSEDTPPLYCMMQNGDILIIDGEKINLSDSQTFTALQSKQSHGNEYDTVVTAYIKICSALANNQRASQLISKLLPIFVVPTGKSLASAAELLSQAHESLYQKLEKASDSRLSREDATDRASRQAIEKASAIVSKALASIAAEVDDLMVQSGSLRRQNVDLNSTVAELTHERDTLNQTLGDLHTEVNASRLNMSVAGNDSVFDGSMLRGQGKKAPLLTPPTRVAWHLSDKLTEYLLTWLNGTALHKLETAIVALASDSITDEMIDAVLDEELKPLIIGVFYPFAKDKLEGKSYKNPRADRLAMLYHQNQGSASGATRKEPEKRTAVVLLRMLCPQDQFDSVKKHLHLELGEGGNYTQRASQQSFTEGLTPRPSMKVMAHEGFLAMLVALFRQADAMLDKNNKIELPIAKYLLSVSPQAQGNVFTLGPATPGPAEETQRRSGNVDKAKGVSFGTVHRGTPVKGRPHNNDPSADSSELQAAGLRTSASSTNNKAT